MSNGSDTARHSRTKVAPDPVTVEERALCAINETGFPLQHASLATVSSGNSASWRVAATEFPVTVDGESTRIDMILESRDRRTLLVVEAKRTDPASGEWVFWNGYSDARSTAATSLLSDRINFANGCGTVSGEMVPCGNVLRLVRQIGIGVRSVIAKKDRDKKSWSDPDAVERPCSQLSRHAEGFIQYLLTTCDRSILAEPSTKRVVRVLITTAPLFVCERSLTTARVIDGQVDSDAACVEPADWIIYQHVSDVSSARWIGSGDATHEFVDTVDRCFVRSVVIIQAQHFRRVLDVLHQLFWS